MSDERSLSIVLVQSSALSIWEQFVGKARQNRDNAIRDAHKCGNSAIQIARAVGLTRQQVTKIIRRG